jgi:hypothetical protein
MESDEAEEDTEDNYSAGSINDLEPLKLLHPLKSRVMRFVSAKNQ